jgi:hypothetical protein
VARANKLPWPTGGVLSCRSRPLISTLPSSISCRDAAFARRSSRTACAEGGTPQGIVEASGTGRGARQSQMTATGHQDAFPRPRLSARGRFSQRTFAGTWGNGRDAPSGANTLCRGDRLRACLGPRTLSTAARHSPGRRSSWACKTARSRSNWRHHQPDVPVPARARTRPRRRQARIAADKPLPLRARWSGHASKPKGRGTDRRRWSISCSRPHWPRPRF